MWIDENPRATIEVYDGSGTYRYRVQETGGTLTSNEVTVRF